MEQSGSGSENRKHPRVDLRLKVVVVSENKTFRAHTVNVSLGGLLLDRKVPWSAPEKICQVFLSDEQTAGHIGFPAKIISDATNPFRISFGDSDPRYLVILQSWIDAATARSYKLEAA
ncbi:MAG: PilZ domain-containing protein [Oligoflexia bacterium]|nr:PilZ domain-containing protein [Oligoflexia bacterium]